MVSPELYVQKCMSDQGMLEAETVMGPVVANLRTGIRPGPSEARGAWCRDGHFLHNDVSRRSHWLSAFRWVLSCSTGVRET